MFGGFLEGCRGEVVNGRDSVLPKSGTVKAKEKLRVC